MMATASLLRRSTRTAVVFTSAAALTYTTHSVSPIRQVYAEAPTSSKQSVQWKGFTELALKSSEQISPNVKKLTFSLPSESHTADLPPVTSLLSQHWPTDGWLPVIRPYTPISGPDEQGTITFLIKHYPGGKASTKMHDLKPGDTMKFRPISEFQYTPNEFESMLFVAGGSGITPIWQLTNVILSNPEDKTKIQLVYANNTENDILLRKEIEALEAKYPERFGKVFVVSKPTDGGNNGGFQKGYITKEIVSTVWTKENGDQKKQKILVSGPPAMTESLAGKKGFGGWRQGSLGGVFKELGYTEGDVYKF